MYGHLYSPPFGLLKNHHRVLFSAHGFPSRNLGKYAKTQSIFFRSATTPTEFRVCVFFYPNSLPFVQIKHKHVRLIPVIIHSKRPTQKIPRANKQASGETAAMCNCTQSTHTAHIILSYCERAQAVSSSTGQYPSLFASSMGQLPRQPICLR